MSFENEKEEDEKKSLNHSYWEEYDRLPEISYSELRKAIWEKIERTITPKYRKTRFDRKMSIVDFMIIKVRPVKLSEIEEEVKFKDSFKDVNSRNVKWYLIRYLKWLMKHNFVEKYKDSAKTYYRLKYKVSPIPSHLGVTAIGEDPSTFFKSIEELKKLVSDLIVKLEKEATIQ